MNSLAWVGVTFGYFFLAFIIRWWEKKHEPKKLKKRFG